MENNNTPELQNRDIKSRLKIALNLIKVVFIIALIFFGSFLALFYFRPNRNSINPNLEFELSTLIENGRHNANTDLIYWKGYYYFIYANQPGNQGSDTTFLELQRSTDLINWNTVRTFRVLGEDIRDPKFCINHEKLFIYYLNNKQFIADPYGTQFVYTVDGVNFTEPQNVLLDVSVNNANIDNPNKNGWLFWRPKTLDNVTWYVPGYWYEKGQTALFKSNDGINWTMVSSVVNASGSDEVALTFLPDNRILMTVRVEIQKDSVLGDENAGTMLCVSEPPYTDWNNHLEKITRLDGPVLFNLKDPNTNQVRCFALGRFQPDLDDLLIKMGSIFSRKYTSLFEFTNLSGIPTMKYISDIPSSGDTSYLGVVEKGERLYFTYYSSPLTKDYPWTLGMLTPSNIYFINMSIPSIFKAADDPNLPNFFFPWDNYAVFAIDTLFVIVIAYIQLIRKRKNKNNNEH